MPVGNYATLLRQPGNSMSRRTGRQVVESNNNDVDDDNNDNNNSHYCVPSLKRII